MAKATINLQKESGGIIKISPADGTGVTELVVPESGNLVSVDTAVTDNAIARYDGTTGKLQNSGVIITDSGNILVGATTDNGSDKLQVNGSISASNKIIYQRQLIGTFTGETWYDTGITTATLGNNILDTFAITVFEDSYKTGNRNYSMVYKFIVGSALNSSNNENTFDIPKLSVVGHASFGSVVSLRWKHQSGNTLQKIQFKVTNTCTFDGTYGEKLDIYVTKLI